jgi:multiple antibiotic resistance protein
MNVTIPVAEMVLFAISLLAMFSPPATLGPAAAILRFAPRNAQRRVAFLVARNYTVIMVLTLVVGHATLSLLGISTAALTVTGGAALLHQGWPLMTRAGKAADRQPDQTTDPAGEWEALAAVPLTFPITIGGGTIAVAVAASGRFSTPADLAILSGICLLVAIPVGLTFLLAGPITSRLGAGAVDAVTRISGIILVALGIQLCAGGLKSLMFGDALKLAGNPLQERISSQPWAYCPACSRLYRREPESSLA